MLKATALAAALLMAGCAHVYTGDEYYYDRDGQHYSCREPAPYLGGNCRLLEEWPEHDDQPQG